MMDLNVLLLKLLICLSFLSAVFGDSLYTSSSSSSDEGNNEDEFNQDQLDLAKVVLEFFAAYSEFFVLDFDTGVFDQGAFFSNDATLCDVGGGCLIGLDEIKDGSTPFQGPVNVEYFNFKFLGINPDLTLKPVVLSVDQFITFPNGCQFIFPRIFILYFNDENLITYFLAADKDSEPVKAALELFFQFPDIPSCD